MSGNISAPITLNGFFGPDSDDDDTDIKGESAFSQIYEVTEFHLGSSDFKVRQFSWHKANGNQVMEFTYIKCSNKDFKTACMIRFGLEL